MDRCRSCLDSKLYAGAKASGEVLRKKRIAERKGKKKEKQKRERKREMTEIIAAVISAVITGGVTLLGVLIANGKSQAVTETKLDELTREVREHNNFARRVPVVEEQIRVMDRRMTALEKYKD